MERTRNTKEAIINKIETMFEMESGIACPNTHFSQNGRIVKISLLFRQQAVEITNPYRLHCMGN